MTTANEKVIQHYKAAHLHTWVVFCPPWLVLQHSWMVSYRFSVSTNTNCLDKHCQYQHIKPIYIVNINTPVDTYLDAQWQAKPPISLVWTQNWKHLIISWNIYIAAIMISPSTGVLLSGKRALLVVVTLGKFVSRCNKPLNSRKLPLT